MSDLIDRQDAINAVISLCGDCDSGYCGSCRVNFPGEKDVRKVLEDLPPAKPKMGRWKTVGMYTVECSECKAQLHELEYTNFCPNCGAYMQGICQEGT